MTTRLVGELPRTLKVCPYCDTTYLVPDGAYTRIEATCDMPPPAKAGAVLCDRKTGRPIPPYTLFHYCERGLAMEIPRDD